MTDIGEGAISGVAQRGRRLAKLGLAAAVVSRVFSRLVGIVLVVLLAREAAPETVAVYGYLLGTATLVVTLTDLGVAAIAGREVAAGRLPAAGALYAALMPHAVSLLVAAAVTVGITVFAGPASIPTGALLLTVAFVVVGGFVNLWAELLRATGRALLEGGLQSASAVMLVLGGVLVIHGGGDATDLLVIVLVKEALVLAVGTWLVRPRRDPAILSRGLMRESIWLAVAGTASILLWRQGMLVMGAAGTIGALSTYVVASRFLDAGVTIGNAVGFGLVPGISALAGHHQTFRQTARRYVGLAAVVGISIAAIGLIAARPITVIAFGARWADAVPAVRVIAMTSLPLLLTYVAWPFLLARGQVRLLAVGSVAGAVAGLSVSITLVGQHPGALSAAIGTAAGTSVLATISIYGLRDLLRRPWRWVVVRRIR